MKAPLAALVPLSLLALQILAFADGVVRPPRAYQGSLEERSQEAIIVFQAGKDGKSAVEDLILKIHVSGKADEFAWVVPLPNVPETRKEDASLFKECFDYTESRRRPRGKRGMKAEGAAEGNGAKALPTPVEVISRQVVGSYDVAVVREKVPGTLNAWLEEEGFKELEDAEETIGFYRDKGYVFACMKVADTALSKSGSVDLHPLRFTFETGGRDGIYFPMKMTGLQKESFDVNLYVFYKSWLNDHINGYGYEHRGFDLHWRDFDSRSCKANAGKTWSAPKSDPYLEGYAGKIPGLTKYFQKRHPGARFYLTNIYARGIKPEDVREWDNDLWLFPYYTDADMTPYDARKGGPASTR